jgi:uncharacterized protein YuzE
MSVTIGRLTFDHATYDPRGDVLYLHVGESQVAADFEETPEGHAVRYGADGQVVGVTIVNARWLRDQGEPIVITIPSPSASPSTRESSRGDRRGLIGGGRRYLRLTWPPHDGSAG